MQVRHIDDALGVGVRDCCGHCAATVRGEVGKFQTGWGQREVPLSDILYLALLRTGVEENVPKEDRYPTRFDMICSHDHLASRTDTRRRLKEDAANAKSAARNTMDWAPTPFNVHCTFHHS
jgi:hypothetical protein